MKRRIQAFTLVELMVVLAVLVVLAGGAGVALQRSDHAIALQAGQTLLARSLASARVHATLTGRNASVAVPLDPAEPNRSLRAVGVAVRDQAGVGWIPAGGWLTFPPGVALVPPSAAGNTNEPAAEWADLRSSGLKEPLAVVGGVTALLLEFTPRGTVVGGGGDLVLAPCRKFPAGGEYPFVFQDPDAVRGLTVSAYGVTEWIHERAGF